MTLLLAKGLKKSYQCPQKITILSDVSLSINRGESVAICGRSGEGKTTLFWLGLSDT